ncbi:ribosome-recycling factor, mitochondrial isoform X2 [Hemicordylus capensis]|uniref:ribosome-recycling factor, mitochondrial isoform X2 n=1 Tax=Hemicordylus capensis TaxID=884348 RepID=UPI0023024860|nr:ribosome-recycling factor, mitochondrial isoform X2 [Hemicordylus capensis]XP_053138607.1 ribosome-recycling factor, mitochondrial isoform X2 [Hemicordylus capensis]XP_053138608.1 ribosome-recycling factor, mitochondrial isoform X2 [Hemicordylus capensis]XP_053138609.1 ribosome-recycling factor, mitochondrial isoform X2 [Hemicordylus capensis]
MAASLRCLRQGPVLLRYSALGIARSLLPPPPPQAPLKFGAPILQGCKENGFPQALQTRHLATKKAKTKGKSQARVNLNASLVEDIVNLEEVQEEMRSVLQGLQEDFGKSLSIRTSPGALDHITVVTKEGKFPLNQLGQISMKSPQLLVVNMSNFPESSAAAIKAIQESGMNLNPEAEGSIIRVPVPKVTREHRESLATLAKQLTHKAKESLRKVRAGAINRTKKAKGTVSEDTIRLIEKQIQQMADDTAAEMEKLLAVKTKELLG